MFAKEVSVRVTIIGCGLLFVTLSTAFGQCAPGVPCAGNPAGIPPDQPNSPYHQGGDINLPNAGGSSFARTWASFAADEHGRLSWTVEQRTDRDAARKAMSMCRKSGEHCQTVDTFSEACGVPAFDVQGRFYMGYSASITDTERYALEKCDKTNPTGHCRLASLPLCTGANWSGNGYSTKLSQEAADVTEDQLYEVTAKLRSGRRFWGAFVVGQSDNAVRISLDELTKQDAESHAMTRCQGEGCHVLASFENSCAAIGFPADVGRNSEYLGPIYNMDAKVIHDSMNAECNAKYGNKCQIMVRCTGASYRKSAPFVADPAPR